MIAYQLGRISVGLGGRGAIFGNVENEISESLPEATAGADITFEFCVELPKRDYQRNGRILLTPEGIRVDNGELAYEFSAGGREILVRARPRRPRMPVPEIVSRARNWNFLTQAENAAKNFMYGVFDWTTQITNIAHGQSYLHASSMCRDGQAVAVMAWGGVGKTTTMLKLCTESEWRFMSDDLGLIADDGTLYRTPKRLQVYGYNLEGQPRLADHLLGARSLIDRASFAYRSRRFGPKKVRRRVSAEALLGADHVADQAQLTDIIFLERGSVKDLKPKSVPTDDLADRMAAIVMAEIEPFTSLAREAEATGTELLVSPHLLQRRTAEVLRTAFARRRAVILHVGETPTPNELARTISDYLDSVRP